MVVPTESRKRNANSRWTTLMALGCAALVILGSCDFRTTRYYPDRSTAGDGAGAWAAGTFTCGVVAAILLLWVALRLVGIWPALGQTRWRTPIVATLLASASFVLAAVSAGRHWWQVLSERDATEYVIEIARGLPVVTFAAAIGAVFAVVLVFELRTGQEGDV